MRRVSIQFCWFDLWIGAYWSQVSRALCLCPLPMVVVRIDCAARTATGGE